MTRKDLDQYVELKKKATLSPEEQTVVDTFVAVNEVETHAANNVFPMPKKASEARDAFKDAQTALTATPSTTA